MSVAVSNIYALVTNTVSDCQSRESHINQQANMAVTKIVDSDAFYPCLFRASIHLMVQIMLADGENPVIRLDIVKLLEVFLHLLTQKLRHCYDSIALFCLWRGDDVLPL